jgi:MFS transporter, FHS family, L-fucose permease
VATTTPAAGSERDDAQPFIFKGYALAFALVTSLFFMWAIANSFNDVLIKQFQKALDLTRMQSGLVQTAFYFGYFTMALPAGRVMQRFGYKNGILVGLALYAIGAVLFFPAAELREFSFFLLALYVIASGLAFLETAANPYITVMGAPSSAAQRLNLAQSFNGFGAFIAPFIGGALIFSGIEYSASEMAAMSPDAIDVYRATEAAAVQLPYLGLAAVVAMLALIVRIAPFPAMRADGTHGGTLRGVLAYRHLRWAIVAQFFYVGAQVGVWSYFINFVQEMTAVGEKSAARYLGLSLMGFMIGRFTGTALMRFVAPERLLAACAAINAGLCAIALAASGWTAVVALGLTSFFMSVMFPTIFALGIDGLREQAKLGSSLIIMTIVGGALVPPLMGTIADTAGALQPALAIPLVCFAVVCTFGLYGYRSRST